MRTGTRNNPTRLDVKQTQKVFHGEWIWTRVSNSKVKGMLFRLDKLPRTFVDKFEGNNFWWVADQHGNAIDWPLDDASANAGGCAWGPRDRISWDDFCEQVTQSGRNGERLIFLREEHVEFLGPPWTELAANEYGEVCP